MSVDVGLLVSFRCSEYDGVAALARRHLDTLRADAVGKSCPEAIVYLEHLAEQRGNTDKGPKNGLSVWTYGGNHTRPEQFVEDLRPFWERLLRSAIPGGPLHHDRIVVLYQNQDDERITALEVYLDLPDYYFDQPEDLDQWPLVVVKHGKLPFRW